MTGQYGVPVILVGEKAMVGWNEEEFLAAAASASPRSSGRRGDLGAQSAGWIEPVGSATDQSGRSAASMNFV